MVGRSCTTVPSHVGDVPFPQSGRWRLYLYPEGGEDEAEEELYTEDNVLVCSRGPEAHRAFTLDAPVSNALRLVDVARFPWRYELMCT